MVRRAQQDNQEPAEKVSPSEDLREGSNTPRSGFAQEHLLSFVERFERLSEEISCITADRKEVMAEAKSMGFDTKTMRQAIARRKLDSATRQEMDAMLDLYEDALRRAERKQVAQSTADGA